MIFLGVLAWKFYSLTLILRIQGYVRKNDLSLTMVVMLWNIASEFDNI